MSKFSADPGYQAFRLLQFTFVVAPLLAGLDKFFYFLTDWSMYLSPLAMQVIGHHDRPFMMGVGIVEVIAGLGTWWKPKFFAYIVSLWLLGILVNLLLTGHYFDIALRDLGLALGALALGRLSQKYASSAA